MQANWKQELMVVIILWLPIKLLVHIPYSKLALIPLLILLAGNSCSIAYHSSQILKFILVRSEKIG